MTPNGVHFSFLCDMDRPGTANACCTIVAASMACVSYAALCYEIDCKLVVPVYDLELAAICFAN